MFYPSHIGLKRVILSTILIAGLFISLIMVPPVSAAPTPTAVAPTLHVLDNGVKLRFPDAIEFHLSATSPIDIAKVSLLYSVVSTSCIDSQARQEITVTPGKSINLSWTWDLGVSGNLPPGSVFKWQWEIIDAQNNTLLTDPRQQRIEDPNFKWQKITQAPVTLYWANGGQSFGKALLDIAVSSLGRIEKKAGLKVTEPIQIIIYPSAEEMRSALVYTSEWAGGVAFPNYHVVLIGIAPTELTWAKEVIPHELTHLVTGMRIFNCADNSLPTWLNEGISEYAQGAVPKTVQDSITVALRSDSLPALSSLAHGFSADSDVAEQNYNESWMAVTYLIDTLGADKLDQLLGDVQKGQSFNQSLRAVYGLDTDGIDQAWRASLGFGSAPVANHDTDTPAPTQAAVPTLALLLPDGKTAPTLTGTPDPAINPGSLQTPSLAAAITATPQPTLTPRPSPTFPPADPLASSNSQLLLVLIPVICFFALLVLLFGAFVIILVLRNRKIL